MLQLAIIPQSVLDGFEGILEFWHGIVGSWGLAIVMLTVTIRLAILPLTFSSVKSMQKLQVLQPEMKKIQERYKDDKQRMNQEVMKFYQERQVNPLASCLPLLLQIPFFIALFELLRSKSFKADIEGEESFLFIPDLAEPLTGEPVILAIMVVIYIATQLAASAVTMIGGDKNQQRIMFALPFVFTIFIINFEAGLIVYWITTNVWTIGQQLVVRKLYPKPDMEEIEREGGDGKGPPKPARGKPSGGGGGAAGDGKPARERTNGASAKPPPSSPRKKKKRSGRRR
ncbi:MAG TPA: YidC/Oxa1 family membrane protein insertase [Thermoleophilaceae bacterium]|nr:YidC/Oxa1 family membrane protein insertase [Thermoleophilaceae bacterium]